jgi:hypothetical protein
MRACLATLDVHPVQEAHPPEECRFAERRSAEWMGRMIYEMEIERGEAIEES